ncbi:MAG: hypothetical protein AAF914_00525 [Pseudomonadota bacterium]
MMGRLFRLFLVLAVLAALALIGYAYSGWMTPEMREVTEPVTLDLD